MRARDNATKTYRIYTYDVWGNEEDGFDVNDVHMTSDYIEVPVDAEKKDVVAALKELGVIHDHIPDSQVDLEWDWDAGTAYIRDGKTGRPEFEIRLVDEAPPSREGAPLMPFFVREKKRKGASAKLTRAEAEAAYYKLPVTASPCDFLGGHGNWGLSEEEYREATRLARIACTPSRR